MELNTGSPGPSGFPEGMASPGELLQNFYAGSEIPCPFGCGGAVHSVRVSTLADGRGDLLLECGCCAQRERVTVPSATESERRALASLSAPGVTPLCPRHSVRVPLRNSGRQLVCPECGVRFRG